MKSEPDMQEQIDALAAAIADVAAAASTLRRVSEGTDAAASMGFIADGLIALHNCLSCRLEALQVAWEAESCDHITVAA